jgi:hypothetical protein
LGSVWKITVGKIFIQGTTDPTAGNYQEIVSEIYLVPGNLSSLRNFTLYCDLVIHQILNQSILFSVEQDWQNGVTKNTSNQIGLISVDIPTGKIFPLKIKLNQGSWWNGFKNMVALGSKHIAEGTDHLLFLLVLLLPAPLLLERKRWGGFGGARYSIVRLLKVITAFTMGHSITLLAGVVGWLRLPSQPIEILIAFSILVSTIHALRPVFPGREAYVAAGFGLIHGLAFADTLANLNLAPGQIALSILGFNIGIELMQLFVIALTVPWLILLSRTPAYSGLRITGALLAGVAALAWMTERLLLKANPLTVLVEKIALHAHWMILLLACAALLSFGWERVKSRIRPLS